MKPYDQGAAAEVVKPLQVLWEDGERIFCRASRADPDGEQRTLIVVVPASENPTTLCLDRLAHEYSLKDQLDVPWAVRPQDLVRERGRTMLVLDDPGAEPLYRLLGTPIELPRFLRLAEALAAALRGLHERGLIHKDISPANILVNDATDRIWLTGFGIASRLPRERQAPSPPEFIAGTLAYMAPEQTGRMNRSIDSRSDLYALGVTFYQMLTGSLPFTAPDPMEWVHCHIARAPAPPRERLATIPAPISQLVMKLLAKTAEERYQTAAGVEHDLRRCRAAWETRGRIDEFPLAEHDAPDRLLIPETLYGRSREVAALLESFLHVVSTGLPELVLVSGYSGVGKSSVVNELHKVLVPPRGLFASGKFDQYKRDIPYATLAQAFQSLVRQILSKSEAALRDWRDALREALGPNGLLIVVLIPELELVIGKQPPVPDLAPQDAQRRFQTVLRRFIGVFARPEHPLALFLDDLQWLDAATLNLLEDLLTQGDVRHLLLVGAYRDNEVDAAHPLIRKLDAIRQAGAAVQDIVLSPLSHGDLGQLIADTLHCEPERARPLVQLVREKTGGNPFFAIQFLHALADEALLVFDHGNARWSWDLDHIHAKHYTDNVVDLMVEKLNRLPAQSQVALRQLACVGSPASFALLGTVCQTSQGDLHDSLWEAVRSGLVLRSEDSYAFQHDRVQEAAYSLIPDDARAETHLRIGRLLLAHTPPDKREEIIFEIVSQFDRSLALVNSRDEREQVAQLNLMAGKRARNAAAYSSAMMHFTEGRALLPEDCWVEQYRLLFDLEIHLAECEHLTGEFAAAENRLSVLVDRATNLVDRAAVARQRLALYTILARLDRAVEVGLEFLTNVGIEWSPHPTSDEIAQEYDRIWRQLEGRSIEQLVDLPLMKDPGWLAVIDVLTAVSSPAIFYDSGLGCLMIGRMINLSLAHGHTDGSITAYVYSNLAFGCRFNDYVSGFRFAKLGFELMEQHKLFRFKPRVDLGYALANSWINHVSASQPLLRRAFNTAREAGDIVFMGYALRSLATNLLAGGTPLAETQSEAESSLEFARKAGFGLIYDIASGQLGLIRTLRGRTSTFGCLSDSGFDELRFEQHVQDDPRLIFAACWYWVRKLQARYYASDYTSAIDAEIEAHKLLSEQPSFRFHFEAAEYHFYAALARAAHYKSAPADERARHLETLHTHHKQLTAWAENGPENFENRAALVGAELARLEGRELDAERLYEQAIRSARANGFVHQEALACEVAARFYSARGLEDVAVMYLSRARDGYRRWGADGKVRQLEARYPRLAIADPRGGTREITTPDQQLDLAAIVKASQALSSEILLPRLIERLMTIALQNAGADRGLLILPHQNDYRIEAEARTDGEGIVLHYGASAGPAAPETIIRYVMRTQQRVILDDAAKPNLFSEDPYFGLQRPRSILCLPLVRQGVLGGLLYLENTLAPHVFTPDRARLLALLASQAAISLENTRLYADLQERESRVRRLFNANVIGIFTWNLDGRITDANEAFLRIVGYDSGDLLSGHMRWKDLMPSEWDPANDPIMEEMLATSIAPPFEGEYVKKDGSRVPALIGAALFDGTPTEGVAFVVDLTERRRAEALARERERQYHESQIELAHANRITTMGQLSASITHELSQPLSGVVINAETALLLLRREEPKIAEALNAIMRVVRDGMRAGEIFGRIRTLVKKTALQKDWFAINEVVLEVIGLTHGEVVKSGVLVQTGLSEGLPLIQGDRVQLQQVVLNLIMNAVEAIRDSGAGPGEILISTDKSASGGVYVSVQDSGPGIDPEKIERIFDAFYTTKAAGLGMGLSICRSIVEAHGGKLWATTGAPRGAVFQFTVPIDGGEDAPP